MISNSCAEMDAIGRLPIEAWMKSSSQRSFFMVAAERPSFSTFVSHSSATALKLLEAATGP